MLLYFSVNCNLSESTMLGIRTNSGIRINNLNKKCNSN